MTSTRNLKLSIIVLIVFTAILLGQGCMSSEPDKLTTTTNDPQADLERGHAELLLVQEHLAHQADRLDAIESRLETMVAP